ncbi:MAG: prephenate dehydrogenase/arogenate dehydrogenase family protein [Candidatus Omnitrophota bacterium]
MKQLKRITIIGVGLIGGSIALAAKKRGLAKEIIGVFRHRSTLRHALARKAVDQGVMSVAEGVREADLIILATPVGSIPGIAREALRYAKKGAIITDAGSTKRWVVGEIEKMVTVKSGIFFVGSHPMAGSEHTGVEYAKSDLFEGSPCIVVKSSRTDRGALRTVKEFWRALGGRVEVMTPSGHDESIALISHLPHLVAFSLAGTVPVKDLRYAAEGFKDTTRVASSDPELWAGIFLSNREKVLRAAHLFEKEYRQIMRALSRKNAGQLVKLLAAAKTRREHFIDLRYK